MELQESSSFRLEFETTLAMAALFRSRAEETVNHCDRILDWPIYRLDHEKLGIPSFPSSPLAPFGAKATIIDGICNASWDWTMFENDIVKVSIRG